MPSMHVQFFPVCVLTCGAHNPKPSLSFDVKIDFYGSHNCLLKRYDCYDDFPAASVSLEQEVQNVFDIQNVKCLLQGLGLLNSLGQIPLFPDPHSLQGVYLGYLDLVGYAS